jgi:hypothetical protein
MMVYIHTIGIGIRVTVTSGSQIKRHTRASQIERHTSGSQIQRHTSGSQIQRHTSASQIQRHTLTPAVVNCHSGNREVQHGQGARTPKTKSKIECTHVTHMCFLFLRRNPRVSYDDDDRMTVLFIVLFQNQTSYTFAEGTYSEVS